MEVVQNEFDQDHQAAKVGQVVQVEVTAAKIHCRWMIDTKEPAPGRCKCNLVECDNPESSIYRNLGEKPFRWKATLCNLNNCRLFTPEQ